ncbi:hypothetical protein SULI_11805 [Saccharolobus solfataricus]|nr:hypothetical protein [Saccharolobus solfataricus]AKA75125.1 hypothetical protein SULB_2334 [Saccharolobus solfataricus]AKA77818.1 hypothetical protein SULC_2331 [Saccharolobus solfataricus]AKA80513.1 hypothetical protein SULA_2333 [Saccharolobus solfataricus]AZF69568.1 hypothetical protein SULG_11805 [Saccharolobus solfataricus]AZF72188.1 hypothetical protein SULH_11805 [Saccharolobus solfataricus]
MKVSNMIYIIISIVLAYIMQIFVLYPFTAIVVGVPLGLLSRKYSMIGSFLIGFLSSLSLYLIYPIDGVSRMAEIIGRLINANPFLAILLYPLIYGTISLISALLFYYIIRVSK